MTTQFLRRWILRTAVSATVLASVRTLILPLRTASAGVATSRVPTAILANALRSIGGDVCIDAAERLEVLSGRGVVKPSPPPAGWAESSRRKAFG